MLSKLPSFYRMPQSANCAGKSIDFTNTSTERFSEYKLILLPEHQEDCVRQKGCFYRKLDTSYSYVNVFNKL